MSHQNPLNLFSDKSILLNNMGCYISKHYQPVQATYSKALESKDHSFSWRTITKYKMHFDLTVSSINTEKHLHRKKPSNSAHTNFPWGQDERKNKPDVADICHGT